MNKERRKALADLHSQISAAVGMLGDIRAELEMLRDEEQDIDLRHRCDLNAVLRDRGVRRYRDLHVIDDARAYAIIRD